MSDPTPDSPRPPITPAASDVGSRTPHDRTSRLVMRTRTFTARTVGECLLMAKRELGVEAMILSKKTFRKGAFLGRFGGYDMVEVTFGTYRPADSAPKATNSPAAQSVNGKSANGLAPPETPADFAARLAELAAVPPAEPAPASDEQEAEPFVFAPVQAREAVPQEAPPAPQVWQEGTSRSIGLPQGGEDVSTPPRSGTPPTGQVAPPKLGGPGGPSSPAEDKPFHIIKRARARLAGTAAAPAVPYPGLLQSLTDSEVAPALARSLVDELPPDLSAPDAAAALRGVISGRIRIFHPLRIEAGREMRMMAFFGPTGVGKTLTVVKLAAQYALVERRTVGIVTLDTQRIAAAQQLQTYGQILRVPVHVAQDRADVVRLLTEMRNNGTEVALLDTPGRSPNDMLPLGETGHVFDEMGAIQKFLELPAGLTFADMENAVARFGSITTPDALVLTKLDETSDSTCFGRLLTMQARHGLPLAYVTTGQRVPDDIMFPDAGAIAARILLAPAGAV